MSRWVGCPCGAEQSDVSFPAPNKAYLIKDADLDAVTLYGHELVSGTPGEDGDVPISADGFEARASVVWLCWNCGRLLIFAPNGEFVVYEKRP